MAQRFLDRIDSPSDLKALTREELAQVAQEARDTIISVITGARRASGFESGCSRAHAGAASRIRQPTDSLVWTPPTSYTPTSW